MLSLINIQELLQVRPNPPEKVAGSDMSSIPSLKNAWITLKDGLIHDFGTMDSYQVQAQQTLDLTGKTVLPTYCDPHTHLVFAATREQEFVQRIAGATYEEIAQNGGGILNSARVLQNTPQEQLFESAQTRLHEIIKMGTGAVEIKSGYGLTVEAELNMLRVIQELKTESPITIKSTFLGAHAMPLEYKNNRQGYINLMIDEMLPNIAQEKLADYIDVFCDRGFYTPEETETLLEAGAKYGLTPKIHANELHYSGGIQVGTKHQARSVDHLECTGPEEIQALLQSPRTMPTLLPSTAFFLKIPYPPARKMIDSGLAVALASDYNPGSSPSGNMNFINSLACLYLNLSPQEALNASTLNSAYAMDLSHSHGTITKGKTANLIVTEPIASLANIPYGFGRPQINTIILNGKVHH